ncbi:predicted protein [Nematostella vectensis]|uniref:CHAT domain-containing protein n=1 Tax=Nematostella vectensis TaxID=45351 RepID=A7SY24_NEMVE|nr:predicted protein [Nematostella vectensis]|eukprot:XP_001623496.1 predicted protein [Nematostella vectensis]
MDNEDKPFTHWGVAWERVQRVWPNLPVIFLFLLKWGTAISPLTPAQQIQLLKVCYDIAFLLRNSKMMVVVYGTAGKVYREMRLFDQALACFSTVLEIAKAIGSIKLQATCYNDMGHTYNKLGDNGQAMVNYKHALCIYEKFGEECKQADVYTSIGIVFKSLGDKGQAIEKLQKCVISLGDNGQAMENYKHALCIYEKFGEERKQADVYNNIGITYYSLGDNGQAMENYKHALCIYEKFGEERKQADVYNNIGITYYSLGDNGQAMENLKNALCIHEKFGEERKQADVYNNIGNTYYSLGDNGQAMENLKNALCIHEKFGEERKQADVYSNIGNTYYSLGDNGQAMENYKHALCIYEKLGEECRQARVYNNIGAVFYSLGDNGQAMMNYKNALCIYEKFDNERGQAEAYCNIAAIARFYNSVEGMELYRSALALFQKHGDVIRQAEIWHNIGILYIREVRGRVEMDNEGEPFTHWDVAEWERVQRVRPNLPVIFWFLLIWGTRISPLTPAQQIQLKKVCYDIAFLLRDSEMMVAVYGTAGKVYREMRLFDQALAWHSTALKIAKAIGSIDLQATCYHDMGSTYNKLHNYNKALDYYKQSLNALMKTGEERKQADVYNNIGVVFKSLGDNGQAMVNYKNALCIYEKFGEEREQANVYNNIGNLYYSLGDGGQAMENLKNALCIYEKFGEELKQADVYNNIGNVFKSLGDNGQAMENYKHALCIYEKFGEELKQADVYSNIGNVFKSLGDNGQAMENYKHALCIYEKFGEERKQADVYSNIGAVFKSLGDNGQAMENYKHALCIYEKLGEERKQADVYSNIGDVFKSLGDKGQAMVNYKKALCIHEKFGEERKQADVYSNIGNTYNSLGDNGQAMENYKHALCIYEKLGEECRQARVYNNIGAVFYSLGDNSQAMMNYKNALCIYEKFDNEHGQATAYCNIANIARFYNSVEAMELYRSALALFQKHGDVIRHAEIWHNIGTQYLIMSEHPEAEKSLKESLRLYELVFMNLGSLEKLKITVIETYIKTYRCLFYVSIILDKPEQALLASEQGRSRALKDSLQKKYGLESNAPSDEDTRYRSSLISEDNTSFVVICLSLEWLHLFTLASGKPLVTESVPKKIFSSVESETNGKELELLRDYIDRMVNEANAHVRLNRDESFEDRSLRLSCDDDGDESRQPSVLARGVRTATEIERARKSTEVRAKPSENSEDGNFPETSSTNSEATGGTQNQPQLPTQAPMSQATGIPQESDAIPSVKVPQEHEDDTCTPLLPSGPETPIHHDPLELKEGVGIVHIASHGNARTGKILVAPGPRPHDEIAPSKDFLLTLEEIYSCQINARLVVLCCCHSGTGEIRAEGVMGLTRAFLAAGARSVLATLWQISDKATLYFMKRFYRHLVSGLTASASLQQTIRDTIADKDKYSHPYYWGAFILVGDDVTLT